MLKHAFVAGPLAVASFLAFLMMLAAAADASSTFWIKVGAAASAVVLLASIVKLGCIESERKEWLARTQFHEIERYEYVPLQSVPVKVAVLGRVRLDWEQDGFEDGVSELEAHLQIHLDNAEGRITTFELEPLTRQVVSINGTPVAPSRVGHDVVAIDSLAESSC